MSFDDISTSSVDTILSSGIDFAVMGTTPTGFTIRLGSPAPLDIPFSWTAFSVRDANTFFSLVPEEPIVELEVPVEVIPEPILDPEPSVEPVTEPPVEEVPTSTPPIELPSEPVVEPVSPPEVVVEPIQEPVIEPTPELVLEPAPEVVPETPTP